MLLLAVWVLPLQAQSESSTWETPTWTGHVTFLGANAFLGGVTAGVLQRAGGGDFRDGFVRGALGGAIAYGGRRLAVEPFDGAGLLGRQVSAVGVSIARNAADARPSLERLMFPVGPLRLYVDRSDGTRLEPKVGLFELATTVGLAMREETQLDWGASASAGAPVFRTPGRWVLGANGPANGRQVGGAVILSDFADDEFRATFSHERVHVLQHDFTFLLWSDPAERWAADRSGPTRWVYRYVDGGVVFPALVWGLSKVLSVPYDDRLWEIEAMFLEDR